MVIDLKEIRISAKEIVMLLYGSGDLTTDRVMQIRAQEGIEVHQFWQEQYGSSDEAEVFVKTSFVQGEFTLEITGRIDGVKHQNDKIVIEEIKSTRMDLEYLEIDSIPAHLAQAKMYAYMYMLEHHLKKVLVCLTYISVEDREVLQFEKSFTFSVLEKYFNKTIEKYLDWIGKIDEHELNRQRSIEGLNFPFENYRLNQRELMAYVYRNTLNEGILYAIAPTGIGKTIATVFSSLKAISKGNEKIFYLTAKNDGKQVALDTVSLLEEKGLVAKTVEITAKDSMCLLKERDCDPEVCPYAKGYYKKIYKAILDIYQNESIFRKDIIRSYGRKHKVCPFELSLDISNYSDIIISDYNYVFDPRVHLVRYFEESFYEPMILVDEAHNMISRSREMYSATVKEETLRSLLQYVKLYRPTPRRDLQNCINYFEEVELDYLFDVDFFSRDELDEGMVKVLKKLLTKFDQILSDERKIPNKSMLLDVYFEVLQFTKIAEDFNDEFVMLYEKVNGLVEVSIKCLNASEFILQTLDNYAKSCTFFSATLDPIDYYQSLITKGKGEYIKMLSSFPQKNLLLLGVDDVSTRYNDRADSLQKVVDVSKALIESKKGNYILFFPSYKYLEDVSSALDLSLDKYELITQTRDMSLHVRNQTIEMFKKDSSKTQVGLFVMGGIFGESIDLIGEMLSGVVIVGVGLPQLSPFNNILKSHYDETFNRGFDYAYTYPGLNKVIQAVGRVIRTENDRGVAILIDDRFNSFKYLNMYPREWNHLKILNHTDRLKRTIEAFWKEGNTDEKSTR